MVFRSSWLVLLALAAPLLRAEPAGFPLAAPVRELVTSPAAFGRFAGPVRRALEPAPAGVDAKLLLGLRAHLALAAHDADAALRAAAELRALQTDPAERAFSGLVTEAQVAAWRPGAALDRELAVRLAALPATPAMTSLLCRQREKLAAVTPEALLAEADELGRRLDGRGVCDWIDADRIIRLHHRLANVLPLRETLVAAFDAALAARPAG